MAFGRLKLCIGAGKMKTHASDGIKCSLSGGDTLFVHHVLAL